MSYPDIQGLEDLNLDSSEGTSAGRFLLYGLSYVAAASSPNGQGLVLAANQSSGPNMIGDVIAAQLGVDLSKRLLQFPFYPAGALSIGAPGPASGSMAMALGVVPEDCVIEAVWVAPDGALTGGTANRQYVLAISNPVTGPTPQNFAVARFPAGRDIIAHTPFAVYDYHAGRADRRVMPTTDGTTIRSTPPCVRANGWRVDQGVIPTFAMFRWYSQPISGGVSDPGGAVVIRLGTRYINGAIGGSVLMRPGVFAGGWAAPLYMRLPNRYPGSEVNLTAPVVSGASPSGLSISCDPLVMPIASGRYLPFGNGVTLKVVGNYPVGSAAMFVEANDPVTTTTHAAIPANYQAHARDLRNHGYEALTGFGFTLLAWGRNEAGSSPNAWKECIRAATSVVSSPYISPAVRSNVVPNNGGAPGSGWSTWQQPAGGQWMVPLAYLAGSAYIYRGGINVLNKPTLTIRLGPSYTGAPISLLFAAQCGSSSRGGQASITADQPFNDGLACTINTSGADPSAVNVTTGLAGSLTNGGATLTLSAGSFASDDGDTGLVGMLGRKIESSDPNMNVQSHISAIASASVATIDPPGTNGNVPTITTRGYVPMVKRLLNLPAGARTITLTIDAMAETSGLGEFIVLGYMIEDPTNPIAVAGNAHGPRDTAIVADGVAMDVDTQAVLAGTATSSMTGNSLEPAFANAIFVPWSGHNLDPAYFEGDGVHPNALMANYCATQVVDAVHANFTPAQLGKL